MKNEHQTSQVDSQLLSMYTLPGQSAEDFNIDRYMRSTEPYRRLLAPLVDLHNAIERLTALRVGTNSSTMLEQITIAEETVFTCIKTAFNEGRLSIMNSFAKSIMVLSKPDKRKELFRQLTGIIEKGLGDSSPSVRTHAVLLIPSAHKLAQQQLIIAALNSSSVTTIANAALRIEELHVDNKENTEFIERVQSIIENKVGELLEQGLDQDNVIPFAVLAEAMSPRKKDSIMVDVIQHIQDSLCTVGISDEYAVIAMDALRRIRDTRKTHAVLEACFITLLGTGNRTICEKVVSILRERYQVTISEEWIPYIDAIIAAGHPNLLREVMWYIDSIEQEYPRKSQHIAWANEYIASIDQAFDPEVQADLDLIRDDSSGEGNLNLPKYLESAPVKDLLESEHASQQRLGCMLIAFTDPNERELIRAYARELLGEKFVQAHIYSADSERGKEEGIQSMVRESFNKTGSETTLELGNLKNKVIFRHIGLEHYLVWQYMYETTHIWSDAGFDYVPIEPIISVGRPGDVVTVATGVLDVNMVQYEQMSGEFLSELTNEMHDIVRILNKHGIYHGHPHEQNFCLKFFRDEKGEIDYSRKPRIYCIDWDQAKFLSEGKMQEAKG